MHGQFVWYELTTPDVDAARKFYPSFTGWGTLQFDKDYSMWTTGGAPFAGIFRLGPEQRQRGIPPNWMPYIEADNVDETSRRVASLGGKVMHGPEDIPNTGRFAVVQDPQGAVFGIYKSNKPSQSWDGTMVLGRFSWHELMTTDNRKAFDFYRKLFGWERTSEMDMGGGNTYSMYGMKGKPFGGMYNRPPEMAEVPPYWLMYVFVKDVKRAVDAAMRAGATVKQPPMDVPGGQIAVLADPQGATFAVHAAVAAPTKPAAKKTAGAKKTAAGPARRNAKSAKSRPKAKTASRRKSAAKKSRPSAKAKAKRRGR